MRELVRDFTTHPLIPGALLGCVAGDPQLRRLQPLDEPTLLKLNKQTTLETLAWLQQLQIITGEQAERLLAVDGRYVRYFKDLSLNIPEVAEVTGCNKESVKQLARALFSARLMADYLEILTPPQLSYERTAAGTVDLLARLFDCFRQIVGGGWSVFFPRQEINLVTDASAQFWVASLYSSSPEEMMHSFIGYYRTHNADRLQALNRNYKPEKGIHLQDALTEYLDNCREKLAKLYDAVEPQVRTGLD